MTLSLRARLLLAVVLLVLFGLVVADIGTYAALRSYMVQRVDDQLRSTGPNAASLLNEPGMPGPGGDHHGGPGGPSRDLPTGTYVALFTPQGHALSLRRVLPRRVRQMKELPVLVGARERLPMRLLLIETCSMGCASGEAAPAIMASSHGNSTPSEAT